MNLVAKIEALINSLLIRFGELMGKLMKKLLPQSFQTFWTDVVLAQLTKTKAWIKQLPTRTTQFILTLVSKIKGFFSSLDFKGELNRAYQKAKSYQGNGANRFKAALLTPFMVIGKWLQGFTTAQICLLLVFTAASVLAGISIVSSGQRIAKYSEHGRTPASVGDDYAYERPEYYKRQTKHFEINNFRLPVYVADLDQLRSVDIDFIATMSNRESRQKLEKLEFQLRDHLILNIEPSVASFPLEDEGKEIIRDKLFAEINKFLLERKIEGSVLNVEITYILAN